MYIIFMMIQMTKYMLIILFYEAVCNINNMETENEYLKHLIICFHILYTNNVRNLNCSFLQS